MEQPKYYIDKLNSRIWYLPSRGEHYYHRLDGPAIEQHNGSKYWFVNGKQHRVDCQLCSCSKADGRCVCVHHIHSNGPAIEWANGTKEWWVNNKRHRIDGPAIEWANGSKEWWFNGKLLPIKEVEDWIKENKIDLKTVEGQLAFKLRWA